MQQIKIFEYDGNNEKAVNEFLKANPKVEVVNVNMVSMHDLYAGQAPTVCNEWTSTILVYKVPSDESVYDIVT